MKFLNSVVMKLWLTIILIVTTVLIILSVALVSFFNSYFISQTAESLYRNAQKVENVLLSHHDQQDAMDYSKELIENPAGLVILKKPNDSYDDQNDLNKIMVNEVKKNNAFEQTIIERRHVTRTIKVNYQGETHQYILLAYPLSAYDDKGVILLYQDINSIQDTFRYVSLIILISALLLIIITTIFAFFLSTRITKPLLLLKDSAFKVARGEKTVNIETYSRDEIGALAVAFKKMENEIDKNMNELITERNVRDNLIHSMADGVLSYGVNMDDQLVNPKAKEFLNIISQKEKVQLQETINQVIISKETIHFEVEVKNHFYVVIVSPIFKEEHKTGAVALIRDMTEERLNDEMKKRFIANVSHELRTPIQMLQGYTEALLDDIVETKEEQIEFLNIILDESKRLNRLVNELLSIAKYDAGEMNLDIEQVHLEQLFVKLRQTFQQRLIENKVELIIHNQVNQWMLDYDKMFQVFTNLIDNAIRYTNLNATIELNSIEVDGHLVIKIIDNGVGISEEHLQHIFDRFYKADEARTRGNHGTGLGLFIVKSIIERHDGDIQVESVQNKGTTFTIRIPKA